MAYIFARAGDCSGVQQFYSCQNGFRGCCSVDPCNPGATCPDDDTTSIGQVTQSNTATTASQTRTSSATISPTSVLSTQTTETPQSSSSSSSTSTSSASTSTSAIATSLSTDSASTLADASCPAANNTVIRDGNDNTYQVICDTSTSGPSISSSSVSSGGLESCLALCDDSDDCAGVNFSGDTAGTCNLKSNMGSDIACPSGVTCISARRVGQSSNKSNTSIGVIVGPIIAGIAVILIAVAVFLWLRRRKRRTRARQEQDAYRQRWSDQSEPSHEPMRVRDGQSVFAPFGGFYRGVKDMYSTSTTETLSPTFGRTRSTADRPKDYRVVNRHVNDDLDASQLDGRPISELADTSRQNSPSRRPPYQARAYVAPDADLAARRPRDHVMSWNNGLDGENGTHHSRVSTQSSTMGPPRSARDSAPVSPLVGPHGGA